MPTGLRLAAALSALILSFPGSLRAEEELEEISDDRFTRNVSISVGSVLGGLSGNYEHLLARRHGVLAEGAYSLFGTGAGSWTVGAGYRYHFHPGMESLFAGAFVRYGELDVEIPVEKDTYGLSGTALLAGANVGYRWQWANAVTFALRGGYGIPVIKDLAWSPSAPDQAGVLEAFMGFDLELNLGYSF